MSEDTRYSFVLIDDNEADSYLHKIYIKKVHENCDILVFSEAEKALVYLEERLDSQDELPHLVLLDLNMPKVDGWAFLERLGLLESDRKDDLNILVLTASLSPLDQKRSEGYPFVKDFLSKPLSAASVRAMLDLL